MARKKREAQWLYGTLAQWEVDRRSFANYCGQPLDLDPYLAKRWSRCPSAARHYIRFLCMYRATGPKRGERVIWDSPSYYNGRLKPSQGPSAITPHYRAPLSV